MCDLAMPWSRVVDEARLGLFDAQIKILLETTGINEDIHASTGVFITTGISILTVQNIITWVRSV